MQRRGQDLLLGDVRNDRNLHSSETTLVSGDFSPGEVRELGVDRDHSHIGVQGSELVSSIRESSDLGGADKSEVCINEWGQLAHLGR